MLCRGRLHRVGGAVNKPPSPIGRPRKAFKTKLAWAGRGSGGPKTRQPGQLVSVCLELCCGTAAHVALHAASGSASPNASDSPAKCVPTR
jgi:hypothetical protein